MSCDADDIITDFMTKAALFDSEDNQTEEESKAFADLTDIEKPDFKLLPEFGNWMIEAVPTDPYSTYYCPKSLLSCKEKIASR